MTFEINKQIRLIYESKRLTTGLTDVKVTIWNPSGTKVKDSQTMTELGEGIYYYDYTPGSEGTYTYFADSDTESRTLIDKFNVTDTSKVIGGGSEGISADLAFDIKRIADNMAKKKDLTKMVEMLNIIVEGQSNLDVKGNIDNIVKDVKDVKRNQDSFTINMDGKLSDLRKSSGMNNNNLLKLREDTRLNRKKITQLYQFNDNLFEGLNRQISTFSDDSEKKRVNDINLFVGGISKNKDKLDEVDRRLVLVSDKVRSDMEKYDNLNKERLSNHNEHSDSKINLLSNRVDSNFKFLNKLIETEKKLKELSEKSDELKSFIDYSNKMNKSSESLIHVLKTQMHEMPEQRDNIKKVISTFEDSFEKLKEDHEGKHSVLMSNYSNLVNDLDNKVKEVIKLNDNNKTELTQNLNELKESVNQVSNANLEKLKKIDTKLKRSSTDSQHQFNELSRVKDE